MLQTRRRHNYPPARKLFVEALETRTVPAVVNTLADSGPGSLRQAILDTNVGGTAAGDNSITFAGGLTGTVLLQSTLPTVDDDLTINGPGSALVTVKRDSAAGLFRIMNVDNASKVLNVNLSGMTFTGGSLLASSQFDNGGGLNIGSESVTLTGMVISNCVSNQEGGGIAVGKAGVLTIVNSTISGNSAQGVSGTSAAGGSGGGIYFAYDGKLTVLNSTISGNSAANRGGGIYLYAASAAAWVIRGSTLSGNKCTGALGSGGAIALNANANGSNSLTVQNSTIVFNAAGSFGNGGGIRADAKSLSTLESSILSNNTAFSGPDLSNASTSNKFTATNCAIGSTSGASSFVNVSGNLIGKSLLLGTLQDNGGPTFTHLPAAGSPVIDVGSNPAGVSTDQRGLARTFDDPGATGTTNVDIGAVEVQPFGVPTATATATNVTTSGGTSHTVTVTYDDNTGIKVSTLGTGDITVSGPGGFTATPTFVSVDVGTDGKPRVATYTFTPPGSKWDASDNGSYTVSVVAGQVADISGNNVAAGPVGTFQAIMPRTYVVTNANDDGAGSLRQAILDANALTPSTDTITFDSVFFSTPRVTTLVAGQMVISDSVTIVGPGADNLMLDAAFANRHFVIDGVGTLNVTISKMSLLNGRTVGNSVNDRGGSVQINDENVTLDGVVVSNNATAVRGGAISLQGPGTLNFINGKLSDNATGTNFVGGGAVSDAPGHSFVFVNSTISGNTAGLGGGALYSVGGSVSINGCTVAGNSAPSGDGGGLLLGNQFGTSKLTVTDSVFFFNTAGGQGGAITVVNGAPGVTIRNSTFSGNAVEGVAAGGLLFAFLEGPVLIQNCTIAYNEAQAASGLAVTLGTLGTVTVDSTIIAQNIGDPGQPDFQGTIIATNCLVGVVDGIGAVFGPGSNNNMNGDMTVPLDPLLGPLDNNGGPTLTHALLTGSPAINAGINPAALSNDQRGAGYSRQSGVTVDIGAFEVQGSVSPPTISSVQVNDGTAQRSLVKSLQVTFSEAVTFPNGINAAFQLTRTGPGLPNGAVNFNAVQVGNVVTLTFAPGGAVGVDASGSLLDGVYQLTVAAGQVQGAGGQLDGDGNGTGGDNYSTPTTGTGRIHRLFGDADGNGSVTASDFNAFRLAYGAGPSIFDFDNDGQTSAADFNQFRIRYGVTI